jgi:ATP-dependent RNA helicase RhlE
LTFKDFNFDPRLLEGIEAIGYEIPTPVQEQVIPPILVNKDVIACAQTGTGKTAAFLLPIIHKIISEESLDEIKALVIVPTRELAVQIAQHMEGISYFTPVSSIAVYGGGDGSSFGREKKALEEGVDMVVCTPGRMIAHLSMGYVDLTGLRYLVLDEADRMLDMGFYDDIIRIISYIPEKRQSLLFSATMPGKIRELARKILVSPAEVNIALSEAPVKIKQSAYVVYESQKIPLVKQLLESKQLRSILVFCSTKIAVKELSRNLKKSGLSVDEIHSDLEQEVRESVLANFKNRKLTILVATDILSRGIDIEDIDLVINFDVPHDAEDYIHRIGRTARAESEGEAITLISPDEQGTFGRIEDILGKTVLKAEVPAHLGTAPQYVPGKSRHVKGRHSTRKPFRHNQHQNRERKR